MYRVPRTPPLRPDKPFRLAAALLVLVIVVTTATAIFVNRGSHEIFALFFPQTEAQKAEQAEKEAAKANVINAGQTPPAFSVMKDILGAKPAGFSKPIKDTDGTSGNALGWVCGYEVSPAPVLADSLNFRPEKATFTVQILGAGQASKAIDTAFSSVQSCDNNGGSGGISSGYSPISGAHGFIGYYVAGADRQIVSVWQRGDLVLSVASNNQTTTRKLTDAYDSIVTGALKGKCLSLEVEDKDAGRSPFYDADAYTGWNRGRLVELSTTSPGLGAGVLSASGDVTGDGMPQGHPYKDLTYPVNGAEPSTPSWSSISLPERPLEPVPTSLPEEVAEPGERPAAPSKPDTETTIPERVNDPEGPGCGWAFVGQTAPVWDASAEKKRADKEAKKAQTALQKDYRAYVGKRVSYVNSWTDYYKKVLAYNNYTAKVKAVAAEWEELNTIRAEYRAKLDAYWASVNAREAFQKEKKQAQKDYDEAVEKCQTYEDELAEARAKAAEEDAERQEAEKKAKQDEADKKDKQDKKGDKPDAEDDDADSDEGKDPKEPKSNPTDEVEKPDVACPAVRPDILDQDPPAVLDVPAKPNVPLPYAWTDIPE